MQSNAARRGSCDSSPTSCPLLSVSSLSHLQLERSVASALVFEEAAAGATGGPLRLAKDEARQDTGQAQQQSKAITCLWNYKVGMEWWMGGGRSVIQSVNGHQNKRVLDKRVLRWFVGLSAVRVA